VVTKSLNLRTGRSIWEHQRAPAVARRLLDRDIETDVLVIGAGITGAMVADALTGSGMTVVIVDSRGTAKGSTAASTALVLYEIDVPLSHLTRKIGARDATRVWRRSKLAVDAIGARLSELGVRDVVERNSLYLAGDLLDAGGLAREHAARRAAGLASKLIGRKALHEGFGIRRQAALIGYGNLALDPRRTTAALLHAAVDKGARIFAPVEVGEIDATPRRIVAIARNGHRIRCRHLVFATGYEFPREVPHRGHSIRSTYAIATVPQRRRLWPQECLIWEASRTYLYLRTTPDGRIICGGEDEDFADEAARDALLPRKSRTLQKKLARLFPNVDTEIAFAWTGSFGQGVAGLPIIGEVPSLPNCWAALGYGGNGTTYSRIAADIISGALTGHPDIDADLFAFKKR
jgi:glycine/D-amino acid oxidase-like deaminating enzyme